jgi:bleomycin hydrolase
VCIGGDVSEPGYYGEEDAAVVPTFDIPGEYIDQDSRELRFYNRTTEDDHGVHLLAYRKIKGRDWYLIKDSARASRRGEFHGYLFYRGDYIKLKMLTFMVHRDVVSDIWSDIEKARRESLKASQSS